MNTVIKTILTFIILILTGIGMASLADIVSTIMRAKRDEKDKNKSTLIEIKRRLDELITEVKKASGIHKVK